MQHAVLETKAKRRIASATKRVTSYFPNRHDGQELTVRSERCPEYSPDVSEFLVILDNRLIFLSAVHFLSTRGSHPKMYQLW